jgi:hypothetical protein
MESLKLNQDEVVAKNINKFSKKIKYSGWLLKKNEPYFINSIYS